MLLIAVLFAVAFADPAGNPGKNFCFFFFFFFFLFYISILYSFAKPTFFLRCLLSIHGDAGIPFGT
jgi:hypothetical protein